MSIQFNKVTWYSKLAALFVLIATVLFCLYLNARYNEVVLLRQSALSSSSGGVVSATGDVALPAGGAATFDGLQITFDKVTQDSRCPIDVMCIRAGNVTAHVTMRSAGKAVETDLVSDEVPYHFSNYLVSFVRVAPLKYSKVEIAPQNYLIVFHIINILST